MTWLHVLILGAIEGFTEFLPISSTAHLVLATKVLGIIETDFVKSFIIAIQLGAILGIVVLYFKRFLTDWQTNKKIIVAFIPTAVIGFVLYKLIKGFFLGNYFGIALTLLLGGIALIWFEKTRKELPLDEPGIEAITYKQAFIIGCAQSLAVIPGVSRAGATIVGGMLLGISRRTIVEFSFLLAVPTMIASTGYDLLKTGAAFSGNEWQLLLGGSIASFIFAIVGIKFLLSYVQKKSFVGFGWYRILAGALFLLFFI
jgi:undecaprenyl-diphosphatase